MKIIVLSWVLLISFSLLILGQALRLQIIQGKEQDRRAEKNRFRIRMVEAQRGVFYDRKGLPLVEDKNSVRNYLYGEETAHILGYIGEADEQEISLFGVEVGQKVGKTGLEREENGLLRGSEGGLVEEFSAAGEKIRTFSSTPAVAGRNIQLTLDNAVQHRAFTALQKSGYKGAIIAGTTDGKIIAMASYPSFDPNLFSPGEDEVANAKAQEKIEALFNDTDMRMFNRAISGLYPPASTFKIITSIAALESHSIDQNTTIEDTGEISVGSFHFGNWYYSQYGKTEGMINIAKALQRSNDIFFYKIGEQTGMQTIADWAETFGLGKLSGIALGGEAAGLVPTPQWKEEHLNESWYLGDTYITSIGQGNLQVTPIQIQMMTTAVANDGYLCQPSLIASVVDTPLKDINLTKSFDKNRCQRLPVSDQTLGIIHSGLKMACDTGGTGYPLFNFKVANPHIVFDDTNFIQDASGSAEMVRIPVACKTGTAETGKIDPQDSKNQKTHAWFTAYAPADKPEIVVTVLLEEAGQGSDKAAPLAREVLETWFEGKR